MSDTPKPEAPERIWIHPNDPRLNVYKLKPVMQPDMGGNTPKSERSGYTSNDAIRRCIEEHCRPYGNLAVFIKKLERLIGDE